MAEDDIELFSIQQILKQSLASHNGTQGSSQQMTGATNHHYPPVANIYTKYATPSMYTQIPYIPKGVQCLH